MTFDAVNVSYNVHARRHLPLLRIRCIDVDPGGGGDDLYQYGVPTSVHDIAHTWSKR